MSRALLYLWIALFWLGCDGGPFPKTDCRDDLADVFPGQTEHFVPYCPPEHRPVSAGA